MFHAIRSGRLMPRGLLLTLFASALLLRAMVPTGWMPSTEGGFRIELCTGMGAAEASPEARQAMAALINHQASGGGEKKSASDHPCIFTALGFAFAAPDPTPALTITPHVAGPHSLPDNHVTIGHGLAAPPPPSTGPPILA